MHILKGGHQNNYLLGVPMVLIALLVQSKIFLEDVRFLKRCLWRCWSSGMSRPVAWRQWPACCRRAVPSSISSSCLRIGALSPRARNRLHSDIASYPKRKERFRLEVLLWPVPHVHTSTSLVHYFGPTHFLKIILILSCRLPSDLLSDQSLELACVQNPKQIRVLECSAHSTAFLFLWPRMYTFAHFQQILSIIRGNIVMRSSLILVGRVTFRACVPCDLVTAHPAYVFKCLVCVKVLPKINVRCEKCAIDCEVLWMPQTKYVGLSAF